MRFRQLHPTQGQIAYNWPMKKALAVSSFVVVCAGITAAQASPSYSPQDGKMLSVTVPFVADNGHGKPITGISSSDLSLFDDKEPVQRIVALRGAKEMPLRVGLLIDTSNSQGSSRLYAPGVKAALDSLNQLLSGPDSKGFIMTFDTVPHGTAFMNRDELMQAKVNLRPGGAGAIYDALNLACTERMRTDSLQVARRVLVLLSDGDDNMSHMTRSEAIAAAQNAGTVIFTVSTGTYREGDKVLEMIASETGGIAYSGLSDTDMPKVFAKIKTKIEQMYSVTYILPEASKAGQFRSVDLKITSDKKARVRAPRGYYAASVQ
jgi:Ca-activated chloride channel family protein